jgi:para-aminobenzoate synthetase component 2
MIYVLDNYDSFTYNLVQYVQQLGFHTIVKRNDETTPEAIEASSPQGLLLSPGPCAPSRAGIMEDAIQHLAGKIPILGVCLGMQAIAEVFGGNVVRSKQIMHGKVSMVEHDSKTIFESIPSPISVVRYHSLAVEKESLPDVIEVSAVADDAELMGIRHKSLPIEGVQFHPESILTEQGMELLSNWLRLLPKR